MAAHALGPAAYAAQAAGLVAPHQPSAVIEETRWQLGRMSAAVKAALRQLPSVIERSFPARLLRPARRRLARHNCP